MKTNSTSRSGFQHPRVALGAVLSSVSVLLALAGLSKSVTQISATTGSAEGSKSAATFPAATTHAKSSLTYKLITAPQDTWGYDIFADGRLIIHQTNVPALPGNEGFKTKEDATKVALLVIEKVKKGEMPPTVSIDEMKKLSVIK